MKNTVISIDNQTQRLSFHYGTVEDPGMPYNSISKEEALRLMTAISELYGVKFGDPKCPCKDKVPQKFDRQGNRWHIVNSNS